MKLFIINTKCDNPHENLALEWAMMVNCPQDTMILYLWQNRHTVVIGRNQNAWKECATELLAEQGGKLARRSSGGGAVYHDMGNLNFSFIAPPEIYDQSRHGRVILSALEQFGITAQLSGRNDITVDGRKVSGNAYAHIKNASLHHGTLLISVDMEMLTRYLRVSREKLEAKGVKSTGARVMNLSQAGNINIPDAKAALAAAAEKEYGCKIQAVSPENFMNDYFYKLKEEYSTWEWNYGKTPNFNWNIEKRFEWGGVDIRLLITRGIIHQAHCYTDAMDEKLSERLTDAIIGSKVDTKELSDKINALGGIYTDIAQVFKFADL